MSSKELSSVITTDIYISISVRWNITGRNLAILVNNINSYNEYLQWRIQDLPRGDHGEHAEREPKGGLGAEPQRGAGAEPIVRGLGGTKLKSWKLFVYFLYKKLAKS